MRHITIVAIVVICSVAVLGVLIGLQQIVTYKAQITLEEYNTEYQAQQKADSSTTSIAQPIQSIQNNCDPSYPNICISSPPPDLDCKDIPYSDFRVLQSDPHRFDEDVDGIGCESSSSKSTSQPSSQDCSGNARCITGIVTQIIDGDTIKIDGQSIRFALASAPELKDYGGSESKDFIDSICPVGSTALIDEDDGQTEGSYRRIIGVIYCNGKNLNEELVESGNGYLASEFCSKSEFSNNIWAQNNGC